MRIAYTPTGFNCIRCTIAYHNAISQGYLKFTSLLPISTKWILMLNEIFALACIFQRFHITFGIQGSSASYMHSIFRHFPNVFHIKFHLGYAILLISLLLSLFLVTYSNLILSKDSLLIPMPCHNLRLSWISLKYINDAMLLWPFQHLINP